LPISIRRSEPNPAFRTLYCFVAAPQAMVIRAFMRLSSIVHGLALRRAVAIVCAVALLTIGFAHSVHHFGGAVSAVAVQADVGTSDDSPDTSKKASLAIEHCHGCTMIAMAALAQPAVPTLIAADIPVRRFDDKRPHPPVAETPPPISTI